MNAACIVTGAAGFIGSHLVDRLLSMGHRVIGIDNLVLGTRANLSNALRNPNFTFHEADVNDLEKCRLRIEPEIVKAPVQTLWHMAANSDIQAGGADPDVDLRLTFMTTYNALKLMQTLRVPHIVFASSSAIYGERDDALREDSGPLFPISSYGAMKLASEGVISSALERFLERAWLCRFPNVVGGRATHGVIYDFLKKLRRNPAELEVLGDGTQEKPYLHVAELVDAMIFIWRHSTHRLNCFNIAPTTSATTVRYIAEAVVAAAAPAAKIRYTGGNRGWIGDVPKFSYSTARLQALGWRPKLSSNEAVDRAIAENLPVRTSSSGQIIQAP